MFDRQVEQVGGLGQQSTQQKIFILDKYTVVAISGVASITGDSEFHVEPFIVDYLNHHHLLKTSSPKSLRPYLIGLKTALETELYKQLNSLPNKEVLIGESWKRQKGAMSGCLLGRVNTASSEIELDLINIRTPGFPDPNVPAVEKINPKSPVEAVLVGYKEAVVENLPTAIMSKRLRSFGRLDPPASKCTITDVLAYCAEIIELGHRLIPTGIGERVDAVLLSRRGSIKQVCIDQSCSSLYK
jgi:hypothetical protein